MLAYLCKYAPMELLQAFGIETELMEPHTNTFSAAETYMHSNMCSFIKAVLEDFDPEKYEGMIFTTCCDSTRRLYDLMVKRFPDSFFYCLDLPRKINDFADKYYGKQIEKLLNAYAEFSGKTVDWDLFFRIIDEQKPAADDTGRNIIRIGLTGARPGNEIKQLIRDHNVDIAFDMTCTGVLRNFQVDREDIFTSYAHGLLNQMPCMRMASVSNRDRLVEAFADNIDGIICHTVKFCDMYSYEYTHLKKETNIPLLHIETDSTIQASGQILTRLEAFLETIMNHNNETDRPKKIFAPGETGYVMGIDSGSTSTNAVILNTKGELVAHTVVRTGAKSIDSANAAFSETLEKAGLSHEELALIVSTGYGRVSIPFADKNVTEISCHGRGAHFVNPSIRTILDIGGQDSKAIRLDEKGDVVDFVMNDKCAAGTGRFLEMMARTLEVDIEDLGPLSMESTKNIEISSMCSVFAESEVISLIAKNEEPCDIARGVHNAIAGKAISLINRVGFEEALMMTGGVAKNPGMIKVLEEKLGTKIITFEEPEIVGAIGAALYGLEEILS